MCALYMLMRTTKIILSGSWRCTTISNLMINEQIRDKEVRLIGSDGEQLGIMSAKEAMTSLQERQDLTL